MSFITSSLLVSDQEKGLGHCLHSKCHITALFAFVDITRDGYYVAINTSNVWYLTFNDHLMYHKINNLRNLTMNNKISKCQFCTI